MEISLIALFMAILAITGTGMTAEDTDFKGYVQTYDGAGWNDPYAPLPDPIIIEVEVCSGNETNSTGGGDPGNCTPGATLNAQTIRVSQSSDDAEEYLGWGSVQLTSSDLELGAEGSNEQAVGMNFRSLDITGDGIVTDAFIEFTTDETSSMSTGLIIRAFAMDDSVQFTATNGDVTSRPVTGTSVIWNPSPWNIVGAKHQTPDLSGIVQEIIERPGWQAGNTIGFVIEGPGRRTAESYNGLPSAAPLLNVEWEVEGECTPPPPPPPGGNGSNESLQFKMLFINDVHNNEYSLYDQFMTDRENEGVEFLAVNGDMSGSSCYSYDSIKAVFDNAPFPYQFTVGNHDKPPDANCPGHPFIYDGVHKVVEPTPGLVSVSLDVCTPSDVLGGEGIFEAEDEAWLTSTMDAYADTGRSIVINMHCNPKRTWLQRHIQFYNADVFNALVQSYSENYESIIVVNGNEHVAYTEREGGVQYMTVGRFGLCPYEYGTIEFKEDGTVEGRVETWKQGASCSYPYRLSDSEEYNSFII